jgi:hypothetical protein
MATADEYAQWIVKNADKKGTPEFDTVAKAYQTSKAPADPAPTTIGQDLKQGAGNLIAGAVRGAGSIGATIMYPLDKVRDLQDSGVFGGDKVADVGLGGVVSGQKRLTHNEQRRADMDAALQTMGAQPDSLMYQGGKLAGEIAGTAGAGGAVANGLLKVAPIIARAAPSAANAITEFAPVVQSGGLTLGTNAPTNAVARLLLRTGGGAVNGAATAGLVNPSDMGTGAAIGGALPGAVKVAGAVGGALKDGASTVVKNSLGLSTGTGANSVSTAYNAGKEGATTFVDNMRGNVPMTDVLDSAKSALSQMRLDRAAQYKSGMAGVSADKSVIDFTPIDQAVTSLKSMGSYKGQVINKNASGVVDDISNLVNQWKGLDPAEYHTPEGLDALKQAISDIRDTTQFGTAGRKAADTAYNAVKSEITTQAPTYAKVMKDYSQASETLSEIERSLSLGNKAAADTSMRKLQSLMRNNVNTNFGNRLDSAKMLESYGADVLPAVAGQSMSSWTPRGLQGVVAGGAGVGALVNPATLAAVPFTSPRLIGEAAYKLGAANRGAANMTAAAQSKLAQLLGRSNATPISMNQLAPFLAATPVLAATQR